MKHTIAKSFTTLLGAGLLVYVGWLFFQGYYVVVTEHTTINMLALLVCACIALFLLSSVFMPTILPTNRRSLLVLGIGLILASHIYLYDKPEQMVYLRDIMKLVGVFLVIAGPTKLLIPKKIQEKKAEKGVEIIEV